MYFLLQYIYLITAVTLSFHANHEAKLRSFLTFPFLIPSFFSSPHPSLLLVPLQPIWKRDGHGFIRPNSRLSSLWLLFLWIVELFLLVMLSYLALAEYKFERVTVIMKHYFAIKHSHNYTDLHPPPTCELFFPTIPWMSLWSNLVYLIVL